MIFAAGMGTRLKPLTDTLPKALVPVCGKPLLEHVSHKLMAAGLDEAVVNVHHFADKIEEWIGAQGWIVSDAAEGGDGRMVMQVSDERSMLLETGGAIFHARRFLEGCGSFLVHNVDILSDLDIPWFMSKARPDALATLLVSERKSSRYLLFDPSSMRLVGWTNVQTGEVRSPYADLDVSACRALAFSGIHIVSDKVFGAMEDYIADCNCPVSEDGAVRFPIMDFYLSMAARYAIYGVVAESLNLIDVGKLDTLAVAESFLTSGV